MPADERPPVNVVRFAFQTMVGIGTLLALLGVVFLAVRWRRKRLPESRWFYRALVLAGPLSVVALIGGWVTTEVGRQPWVVYRVMRTSEAVTGAGGIPVGYATLALVYLGARARGRLDSPSPRPRSARSGTRRRRGALIVHLYELPLRLRARRARLLHRARAEPTSAPGSGS